MTTRLGDYRWTLIFGGAFLGFVLWSTTFRNSFANIFILLVFVLLFFVSALVSFGLAVSRRSRRDLYRLAINVIVLLLIFRYSTWALSCGTDCF